MSLIQDPLRALDQARWYLANTQLEKMPTAFSLAAGNLLRQVLEQMLFVLGFYSELPRERYLRRDMRLHTAGTTFQALLAKHPTLHRTYLQHARQRHPYLRRLGRPPATLRRWIDALNEPSHFANPALPRKVRVAQLKKLTGEFQAIVGPALYHLVIAAANELRTRGKLRAVLGKGPDHTIGVQSRITVVPKHLVLEDGKLTLSIPAPNMQIVSSDSPEPVPAAGALAMIQHQLRPALQAQFVASDGKPIDLSSFATVLQSLSRTRGRRTALVRRLRKLGLKVVNSA